MKKLVSVTEVQGEGMWSLMGERVTLFCMNYIYTGKLVGADESCVLLEDAAIVYETGAFEDASWEDAQKLPRELYVQLAAVEAFTVLK